MKLHEKNPFLGEMMDKTSRGKGPTCTMESFYFSMLCCSSICIFKSLFVMCALIRSLGICSHTVATQFAIGNINPNINESQYLFS